MFTKDEMKQETFLLTYLQVWIALILFKNNWWRNSLWFVSFSTGFLAACLLHSKISSYTFFQFQLKVLGFRMFLIFWTKMNLHTFPFNCSKFYYGNIFIGLNEGCYLWVITSYKNCLFSSKHCKDCYYRTCCYGGFVGISVQTRILNITFVIYTVQRSYNENSRILVEKFKGFYNISYVWYFKCLGRTNNAVLFTRT